MIKNYYDILGVMPHHSPQEIKKAYRNLAKKYHPDVNDSPEATVMFQEINEAFQILSNPEKKKNYDLLLWHVFNAGQQQQKAQSYQQTATVHYQTAHRKKNVRQKIRRSQTVRNSTTRKQEIFLTLGVFMGMLMLIFALSFTDIPKPNTTRYKQTAIRSERYFADLHAKFDAVLPLELFQIQEVRHLDLSQNHLIDLSDQFANFRNLTALNLNNNQIAFLPDAFRVMRNMEYLNLSNNPLTEFPEVIFQMRHLRFLWLENCNLTNIPLTKSHFPKLEYIFLKGNRLSPTDQESLKKQFPRALIEF